jgi:hypothetical protein
MAASSKRTTQIACLAQKLYEYPMKFKVSAIWDDDAKVFTSESNIPGLVIEAETYDEFVELVEALAPEMLEANLPLVPRPYHVDIDSHRTLAVA